jgi:hypothetical protein
MNQIESKERWAILVIRIDSPSLNYGTVKAEGYGEDKLFSQILNWMDHNGPEVNLTGYDFSYDIVGHYIFTNKRDADTALQLVKTTIKTIENEEDAKHSTCWIHGPRKILVGKNE